MLKKSIRNQPKFGELLKFGKKITKLQPSHRIRQSNRNKSKIIKYLSIYKKIVALFIILLNHLLKKYLEAQIPNIRNHMLYNKSNYSFQISQVWSQHLNILITYFLLEYFNCSPN